jgi:hypothetical protein
MDRMSPYGYPTCVSLDVDLPVSKLSSILLSERKELTESNVPCEKYTFALLYSKPGYCVVSKAFSISKHSAAVGILLLKSSGYLLYVPPGLTTKTAHFSQVIYGFLMCLRIISVYL